MRLRLALCFVLIVLSAPVFAADAVRTPSEALGFRVGADKQLADYHQIVRYFDELAARSPRVRVERIGETTLGNPLIMAVISSEPNLRNAARYQQMAAKLAARAGFQVVVNDEVVQEINRYAGTPEGREANRRVELEVIEQEDSAPTTAAP